MKKFLLAGALAATIGFTGCTTIESTQKFNAISLGDGAEKAVCQSYVKMSALYFFGLPIVSGSTSGNGGWTMFRYNLTTENAMYLLTREAKSKGAARLTNVNVSQKYDFSYLIFQYHMIEASGTGLRSRDAAVRQAAKDFDNEP